jgi:hypothetical protein
MAPKTESGPSPAVAPEVLAFAEQEGVTPYLPAVIEMTRRIFPGAPLRVFVEDDPEIANDRHIVLEVELRGMGVPELIATHRQWISEIFQHCPSTHAPVFRLGMVPVE